jgi:hypothetical protein
MNFVSWFEVSIIAHEYSYTFLLSVSICLENLSSSIRLRLVFFDSTGCLTQGFVHARQALYHLNHSSSPETVFVFASEMCFLKAAHI